MVTPQLIQAALTNKVRVSQLFPSSLLSLPRLSRRFFLLADPSSLFVLLPFSLNPIQNDAAVAQAAVMKAAGNAS